MPRLQFIVIAAALHAALLSVFTGGQPGSAALAVRRGGPMKLQLNSGSEAAESSSPLSHKKVRLAKESVLAPAAAALSLGSKEEATAPGASSAASAALSLNPAPIYPPAAVRDGVEGIVEIEIAVDASGRPSKVLLAKTSGSALLDEAALSAAKLWRFTPAMSSAGPTNSRVVVPVRFALSGRSINPF